MHILSWNTQGSNLTALKGLIKKYNFPEVVLVQEMGAMPANSIELLVGSKKDGMPYDCYALAHKDTIVKRCTTGMMVHFRLMPEFFPPERLGYDSSLPKSYRPPIAAYISGMLIVGIHAVANRHVAEDQIIDLIGNIVKLQSGAPWILGGDLNQNPAKLQKAIDDTFGETNIRVADPSAPTQKSGGTLDFFVFDLEGRITASLARNAYHGSDHLGVITEIPI